MEGGDTNIQTIARGELEISFCSYVYTLKISKYYKSGINLLLCRLSKFKEVMEKTQIKLKSVKLVATAL